jgi:hypothetical protein
MPEAAFTKNLLPRAHSVQACFSMDDEHQDDLEPEVEEGAEWEKEHYASEPHQLEEADEWEDESESEDTEEPSDEHPDEL